MKKIINGKRYDTETAQAVGSWDNNKSYSDFSYCAEYLYRKRNCEFFLYGNGGAMSKYAVSYGDNSWGGGEKIIPLTYEAAQEWAESHLTWDEYEAIFGEVEEDDSRTQLSMSVSTTTAKKIKRLAEQAGMSISAFMDSHFA